MRSLDHLIFVPKKRLTTATNSVAVDDRGAYAKHIIPSYSAGLIRIPEYDRYASNTRGEDNDRFASRTSLLSSEVWAAADGVSITTVVG